MKKLKLISLFAVLVIFSIATQAQTLPAFDKSPVDIAYLRQNGKRTAPIVRVVYGRPQKNSRTMLGGVEPYGKVWRTGANETTEIKLFKDVTFGDKVIPAGTYSLYTIPDKNEWTIIFNSKLDTWGAFEYDESKDVVRFKVPAINSNTEVENFSIAFEGANGVATMFLAWETTLVKIPIHF
jgi:hypothetical protein